MGIADKGTTGKQMKKNSNEDREGAGKRAWGK